MIFTDKAAKEKISSLESRVSDLEADLLTKDEAIETLQTEAKEKDATISEHLATIGAKDEKITQLEAELKTANETAEAKQAEVNALTEKVTLAENASASKAVEILASVGQPEPVPAEENPTSAKSEISNLKGLDKVRAAFSKPSTK